MTKKPDGISDRQFNALVDDGFVSPRNRTRKHGGGAEPMFRLTDAQALELEQEGHAEGISKSAARFNGMVGRIFGRKGSTLNPGTVEWLKEFDAQMVKEAKRLGIELRDE